MHALQSLIIVAAAFGVAASKSTKVKRQCSPSPTPSVEPTPSPPEPTPPPRGEYSQTHDWRGEKWFSEWDHWAHDDPTKGRVEYINADAARSLNISYLDGDTFYMGTDMTTVLGRGNAQGPGRKAVRIESREAFSYYAMVVDVKHMPEGMGTWPALWSYADPWPEVGELDIIEAVNDGSNNLMSLHTGPDCTQPEGRDMKGWPTYHDCYAYGEKGNQGCGVVGDSPESIGPNFNRAGGGWYAVERTETFIKVWFWGRNDPGVPEDVKNSLGSVSPSTWGTPTAHFVNSSCDLTKKFGPNKFIINLTFCGDWAGNAFDHSSGKGMEACERYVEENPQAFKNAYWELGRMNVYARS